jgi:phosphate:Na+ symporter
MLTLLKIAGGVALLLLGVRYLRKGLDRLFGARLAIWMRRVGVRPGLSFLTGVGVSVLAPSSTTISLLAVQTVQAGFMTTRQTLAVMLGANIGLTILVQLVALHLDDYAPIFIFVGFVLFQYVGSSRARGVGQIILALGFFFLAMFVIRVALDGAQLGTDQDFRELLIIAEKYPFWLALISTVMATMMQGATATIGLIIGIGSLQGLHMQLVLPVIAGANVGQSLTTILYGWRQIDSRRLGAANATLKIGLAAVVLSALPWLAPWLDRHMPGGTSSRVANLHTAFNIVVAIVGLPMIGWLTLALERLMPAPLSSTQSFGPKFIHQGPIDSIALAQGQSLREIMHMSDIVRSMLHDVWTAMKTGDERLARQVSERDNKVDLLDGQIKRFLTRLVKEEIERADADEQIRQLQYLREIETIGDIIDKNISELVRKKIRISAQFSADGERELDNFYKKVVENLMIADTAFTTRDRKLAEQLLRHKDWLNRYEQELRDRHYARLNAGMAQSLDSSAIHLDLLTHLKRINSCASHVAYPIVQNGKNAHLADAQPPAVE